MNLLPIDTNELKKIQLQILDAVAEHCERHNISYWLDFGTLLGAVRHKGYIPWDDDIDISMLRADYEKFIASFNKENSRYKACCYENDRNFLYPFGKVLDTHTELYEPDRSGNKLAVNIDVFIYDDAPASDKKVKKIYKKRDRLNLCEVAYKHRGKIKGNVLKRFAGNCLKVFVKAFPRDYFVRKMVKNATKYKDSNCDFVGDFTGTLTYFKCDKSLVKDFVYGEFEGRKYRLPKEYDKLLTMVYGDYMQLPPEDKRVSHHKFEAYAKQES